MTYAVAVRTLCEFVAKSGDLDLRFTPSPTALEGIEGHQAVVARRTAHYQAEVTLAGDYPGLRVRGRADGYDPEKRCVEEIKTHRGDLALQPANHRALHWAQAKVYGWLLCQTYDLHAVTVALVYFNVTTGQETRLEEEQTAAALEAHFNTLCAAFVAWAEQETAHRQARGSAMQGLAFPHGTFRPGQRTLAESVFKAVRTGKTLLAQAPTGIGKTLATLFPALKSLATAEDQSPVDKVFYLAAKTAGRQLALDALRTLQPTGSGAEPLRSLELIARDKACEHPDKACHGDSCPLAQGFYDRLPAARQEAVQYGMLDQDRVRALALAHQICPYYLSQELARWSDVVVGDYNYYFDTSALLFALTQGLNWRTVVLVDEAHNLPDRARAMYSAELRKTDVLLARREAPAALKSALNRVNTQWNALLKEHAGTGSSPPPYVALPQAPEALLRSLAGVVEAWNQYRTEHPTTINPAVQTLYFQALQMQRLYEAFDDRSLFDLQRTGGAREGTLCLRNCIPDRFLQPRFEAAVSTVLFSATLSPAHYYRQILGLPNTTVALDFPPPFRAEQLQVHIVDSVSTRYRDRAASIAPLVEAMARQYAAQPGNYLAYFSSYSYLDQVSDALQQTCPEIAQWSQSARMNEADRKAFLDRFHSANRGIGFAVLGGVFGEGIDLPGDRLIGAFVATLGLPQWNPVNEQMRQRMGEVFGTGYEYAYLYPGLQKVVQAAGRVIRTDTDQGVLYLFDDRYRQPEVAAFLPRWWAESG